MTCPVADDLQAFVERTLDDSGMERVAAHLESCDHCRTIVLALTRHRRDAQGTRSGASDPTLTEPTPITDGAIGRYMVSHLLGVGGMGMVYAAWDPHLERQVAVKLLRSDPSVSAEQLRARLFREGQAMARLSHPNVIDVYEIGSIGEQVFVVMELVDGVTLREWLRREPRTWREIIHAFIAAGEGLAAAHEAGVIHRDFKPDNVLIARNGRICVTDFGLARFERRESVATTPSSGAMQATTLTYSGRLIGTPGYMPPEQMRGEATDERSDIFSFCAALYEALYAARPYTGTDLHELRKAMDKGQLESPRRVRGPSAHRRAIERGLAPHGDDRQQSMAELLAVLRIDPAARRMRRLLVAAVLLVVTGSGLAVVQQRRRIQVCRGADSQLADIWDAARKIKIRDALTAVGAEKSWPIVEQKLDRLAGEWVAMSTQACEAARLRGTESPALFDRRTRCLNDRRSELRATTDMLATADRQVGAHAVELAGSVSSLERCADTTHLLVSDVDPPRPEERERYDHVRDRISHLVALDVAGKTEQQDALAPAIMEDARQLGNLALQAEADWIYGVNALRRGRNDEALAAMHRSAIAAERVRYDDLIARSWLNVAYLNLVLGHLEEGVIWAQYADAVSERIKSAGPNRAFMVSYGVLMLAQLGRTEQALAEARRALALAAQKPANEMQALSAESARSTVASAMADLGHFAEALSIHRELYEEQLRRRGRDHPATITSETNVATCLLLLGRFTEALPVAEEIEALSEKRFGPMNETADALDTLGSVEQGLGRLPVALAHLQRSVDIYEHNAVGGAQLADALQHLGEVELALRKPGGLAALERALALAEAAKLSPLLLAPIRFSLAHALPRRDGVRATQLATLARNAFAAAAKTGADRAAQERDRTDAWLHAKQSRRQDEPDQRQRG